jgi:putative transposase
MPYWRLFYHLVWATKDRAPLLTPEVEALLFPIIIDKGERLRVYTFAVNGMPDHVHVVAAVPPGVSLADYVRQIKGASSHFMRVERGKQFAWQKGYGIFSVSERGLPEAIAYVKRQKERHQAGTTVARLEETAEGDCGPKVMAFRSDPPDPTTFVG